MNLNLCSYVLNNLTKESYTFKGVDFNELEDLDILNKFNIIQDKENQILKLKEKEERAKEKKIKNDHEREVREKRDKKLKEEKEVKDKRDKE